MKNIICLLVILLTLTGCTSTNYQDATPTPVVNKEPIYTYDGFFEGLEVTPEEQEIIDNGILHVSELYLSPTLEYDFRQYPFNGEFENEYLSNHEAEITQFLELKFLEMTNLEIDVRTDRVYDFVVESISRDEEIGRLYYRFDVKQYPIYPGFYNVVEIDLELLDSKLPEDEWDENILKQLFESGWYSGFTIQNILHMQYNTLLTEYHSDLVNKINAYFKSTGRYYNVSQEQICPYTLWNADCDSIGTVTITPGYSKIALDYFDANGEFPEDFMRSEALNKFFLENNMSAEKIIEYIRSSDYYIPAIFIDPYINETIYNENDLRELNTDYVGTMKKFTDENLDWIIEDKNQIKKIIDESELEYGEVFYTTRIGQSIAKEEESQNVGGKKNTLILVRCYENDYPWFVEDRDISVFGDTTGFRWEGSK